MPNEPRERVTFADVTPLVPTGGPLAPAVQFYREQMGFFVVWEGGNMAGICRDGVSLNLIESVNREWIENSSYSIGVSDLDALYDKYSNIGARVGPLEIKPWGRREFHMIVPSGVCFQFYSAAS